MMDKKDRHLCALDIGTDKTVALIGEFDGEEIRIVGMGEAPTRGIKNGMIANIDATASAIRSAVEEAEHMADCQVHSVVIGIAGNHISSLNSEGMVKIKDGEVTKDDINRAIDTAKAVSIPPEQQILHTVIQEFIVDNQPGVQDPLGMSGTRLVVKIHIITGATTAVQNLEKCIQRAELIPETIVLQPLASALAVLTDDDQELGVCCVDMGAGTTDISVFTNGAIRHTAVIPFAGELLTRDLAQALRTPYDAAEHIKVYHGAAVDSLDGMDEMIKVPSIGDERRSRQVERRVLVTEVLQPRMTELFYIVSNELDRAGFADQLSAGIILTGGTSLMAGLVDLAEDVFDLPVRVGVPSRRMGGLSERVRNPKYAAAIGLLCQAFDEMEVQIDEPRRGGLFGKLFGALKERL